MQTRTKIINLLAISLACGLASTSGADEPSNIQKQREEAQQKARPEVEKQKQQAQSQAEKTLDKDALAAIEETGKAIKAIAENKGDEALAAIERATGKINVLVARNPANGLIPVAYELEIIDTAPLDLKAIRAKALAIDVAVAERAYPAARVLLHGLTSEIRTRTSSLPLASYPDALKEAARLLDQKKTNDANTVLLTALNTLVVVDKVTPLPLVLAQTAIEEAQSLRDKDKDAAQKRLSLARNELDRARELGYAGHDPEYAALGKSITSLEKELKGTKDTAALFSELKQKMAAFFKRQSTSVKS